jgi:hypothetical protein
VPGKRWNAFKKAAGKKGASRYEAMRKAGVPKRVAAAVAIKGKSKAGRKAMAKKAARSRKKGA